MRLVFMGSDALAIPPLAAILEKGVDEIVGVVSQPDRPSGRDRRPAPCPLKAFAEERGLSVMVPEKIGDPAAVEALAALAPDLFVVVAYGQYIPSRVIALARHEAINLHPSLLPRYRGPAPIEWAIANGDAITGVSIIYLARKMDAGDILRQEPFPISENDTARSLYEKLAAFGSGLLLAAIDDIRNGTVRRTAQDEAQAVEVRKLCKEDGRIDWTRSAVEIRNRVRAFDPWPGSHCLLPSGEPLKVWSVAVAAGTGRPGEALDDGLLVAAGDGAVRLLEVQPADRKRMPATAFLNGHPVPARSLLG